MRHGRLYRTLLLPGLAVLVPSIFIAVLATKWIGLEREAAGLRGAAAAGSALQRLRSDLQGALQRPAEARGLILETFRLDRSGRLVDHAITADVPGRTERAAALLSSAAESLQRGRFADAAKSARTILACCSDTRDEFGISYAVYASWQLATLSRRSPDVSGPSIEKSLAEIAGRGELDRPVDQSGVRALMDAIPGSSAASALVSTVDKHVARAERRRQAARYAEEWAASSEVPPTSSLVVAPWRFAGGTATIAALARDSSGVTVLVVDHQSLGSWIGDWADRESSVTFDLRAGSAEGDAREPVFSAPLFVQTPAFIVRARQASADPSTDRQRERLFVAAAAAVLALTLVAGGLVVRDVVRERRLAALRATFLAGVTHEIKTPITSMRLLAETLQQGRAKAEDANELLGTIVNEAEHLSDLVDGLLSTSRIESGARTYRPRILSLSAGVQAARQRCTYALEKDGFTLIESGMQTAAFVNADPEALQQAVLNLLGNAMKYSGDSRTIRLTITADERHATVRVEDSGVGVPDRERSKIFTSFYRSESVPANTAGTGLGLALVRHFAEAHGGRVSVESGSAGGSAFSIELPRCAEIQADAVSAFEPSPESGPHHG